MKLGYAFSGAGKVTKITDGVANDARTFWYDDLGRLKFATESAGQAQPSLWFWPEAQRVHALDSVATTTAAYGFTHDANGSVTSGYDVSGAAAAPALRTFRYETETLRGLLGMPAAITRSPGLPVDMLYDDAGIRVRKQSGASSAYYIGPHYELRQDGYGYGAGEGPESFIYVLAGGVRLAVKTAYVQTLHFHHDHQGSTVALTSDSGAVVWSGRYSPHGEIARESGQRATPYLYSGKEYDGETGLYYYGARFYDPAVARFTSPDSIVPRDFDPQALNRYAFARNDPVSRIDSDGHDDFGVCVTYSGGACSGDYQSWPNIPDLSYLYGQIPPSLIYAPGGPGTRAVPTVTTTGHAPPASTQSAVAQEANAFASPWPAAMAAVGVLVADDATGIGAVDDVLVPVVLASALTYELTQRTFITYTRPSLFIPGLAYSGRASGFGTPMAIMDARLSSHHMDAFGFGPPVIDVAAQGVYAVPAIRGREQQLIDFYGGAYSDGGTSANTIRGVAYYNPAGWYFWFQSNVYFGPKAPYTGSLLWVP